MNATTRARPPPTLQDTYVAEGMFDTRKTNLAIKGMYDAFKVGVGRCGWVWVRKTNLAIKGMYDAFKVGGQVWVGRRGAWVGG